MARRKQTRQPEIAVLAGVAQALLAQGRATDALAVAGAVIDRLADQALSSVFEPSRIDLICYDVLRANADPRAPVVLATAHTRLCDQAAAIDELAWRNSFLENVPHHRRLVELAVAAG